MIDLPVARAALADLCGDALDGYATVYSSGLNSSIAYPAVVIGMPRWEFNTQPCMDTITWPISVVVARPGTGDTPVIETLEMLWPTLVAYLVEAIENDQTLSGVCKAAECVRAEPGFLSVQGSDLPAQTINVELYG
jgi:hypothetical protein